MPHGLVIVYPDNGCVLALAYLMNYSGCTATLWTGFAATGMFFPFFSAPLGCWSVPHGSDTSANALFGNLQVVTANKLGLSPALMASANSAGGVMGKMISSRVFPWPPLPQGCTRPKRRSCPVHAQGTASCSSASSA